MRPIHYKKATRERLQQLLEKIGYKVTEQSTDGTYRRVRLPDGTPTDYWLFPNQIEHRLENNRGGSYFSLEDCKLILNEDTVSVVVKGLKHNSTFVQFHNFKTHRQSQEEEK